MRSLVAFADSLDLNLPWNRSQKPNTSQPRRTRSATATTFSKLQRRIQSLQGTCGMRCPNQNRSPLSRRNPSSRGSENQTVRKPPECLLKIFHLNLCLHQLR